MRPDSRLAISNGVVYVGGWAAPTMYALNAQNGSVLRSFESTTIVGSPSVANGVVYFGAATGYLYALDASTGAELWHGNIIDYPSDMAVADGQVFVASEQRHVYAFGLASKPAVAPRS